MGGEEAHVYFVKSNQILHSVQAPSFLVQVQESSCHILCCRGYRSGLVFVSLPTSKRQQQCYYNDMALQGEFVLKQ